MGVDLTKLRLLKIEAQITINFRTMVIGLSSGVADYAVISVDLITSETEVEYRQYWNERERKYVRGRLKENELAALEIMREWVEELIENTRS